MARLFDTHHTKQYCMHAMRLACVHSTRWYIRRCASSVVNTPRKSKLWQKFTKPQGKVDQTIPLLAHETMTCNLDLCAFNLALMYKELLIHNRIIYIYVLATSHFSYNLYSSVELHVLLNHKLLLKLPVSRITCSFKPQATA